MHERLDASLDDHRTIQLSTRTGDSRPTDFRPSSGFRNPAGEQL